MGSVLGSQADLGAQGWARGEERPKVIWGKVQSQSLCSVTSCMLLLQDRGPGWPGASRTWGPATSRPGGPLRGEELWEWAARCCRSGGRKRSACRGGRCEDLEPPTGGLGRWRASCHWKWVSSGSSPSCQGCGRRLRRGRLTRSEALPARAPLGPPSWPGSSRPATQTCSGSGVALQAAGCGDCCAQPLRPAPGKRLAMFSDLLESSTWQRCQCGSPHIWAGPPGYRWSQAPLPSGAGVGPVSRG